MNWPFLCVLGWVLLSIVGWYAWQTERILKSQFRAFDELNSICKKSIQRERFLAVEIIKHAKKGAPNGRN